MPSSFPRLKHLINPFDPFFSSNQDQIHNGTPSKWIDTTPQDEISDSDDEESTCCELCGQSVANSDYDHHYESVHVHCCSFCGRVYPSAHLLSIHLEENHDSFFVVMSEKKNMFQCLVEDKSQCSKTFRTALERDAHMVSDHFYVSGYSFDSMGHSFLNNEWALIHGWLQVLCSLNRAFKKLELN